jgi:ubiquinone/menaquinone biosynthesis C-methylase UbiE
LEACVTESTETSDAATGGKNESRHVCPVWVGYLLLSPLRKLVENPKKILGPHLRQGMTVVEVGPGMGYFSIPMAMMVGPEGRVVCVDIQDGMLQRLRRRAERRGLGEVIETRMCGRESLGLDDLDGRADFVFAMHVVHETGDPTRFLAECARTLAPGGRLLIGELRGHVSEADFERTRQQTLATGLVEVPPGTNANKHSALFERPGDPDADQ